MLELSVWLHRTRSAAGPCGDCVPQLVGEAVTEPIDHRWLGCNDFAEIEGKPDCCTSCHWEDDDGYSRLCESYRDHLSPSLSAMICCAVAGWVGGLTDDQWKAAAKRAEG